MAGLTIELDAAASNVDGTNPGTAYLLDSTNGYTLLGFDDPMGEWGLQWAGSIDTEGDLLAAQKPTNRTVTIRLRLAKSTAALLEAEILALEKKLGKIHREGGTMKATTPGSNVGYYDIRHGGLVFEWSVRMLRALRAEVTVTLPCAPFIRGAETSITLGTPSTAAGWHVFVASTSVPGDVTAKGKLTLTDSSGADQWWATWAAESNAAYTTSAATAALIYEAEGRTALNGASVVTGPSGASGGASNNVVRHTSLGPTEQAILSTQATGGGSHLTHVGSFRVWARVQVPATNTGDVTVSFVWGIGDLRQFARSGSTTLSEELWVNNAVWRLLDLGIVTIPPARAGATQRWEGRLVASSTVTGDDIDVDAVALEPCDFSSGTASASTPLFQIPTSFSALDGFDQSAGALTGKTLPTGGTWAGAGDADDLAVEATGHTARRTAVSDSAGEGVVTGRVALAGSTTYTNIFVQVFQSYTAASSVAEWGTFARYVDASNWLEAILAPGSTNTTLQLRKMVAGTPKVLASLVSPTDALHPAGVTKGMRLQVDDQGRVFLWLWREGTASGVPILQAQHADLATGGTLATGKIGFFDHHISSQATTRTYDNFSAAVPVKDAAIFASQSLEIAAKAEREDSSGTFWTPVSSYVGSYVEVPPAGQENRTLRVIAKSCRNDPANLPDSSIDGVTATLAVVPRYLSMPD